MPYRRTIVVGDVHGCSEELKELLRVVNFTKGSDDLLLIGDLIDRGQDSLGVCELVISLGGRTLLGNHEARLLRWHDWQLRSASTGETIPMRADQDMLESYEQISERPEVIGWLQQAPLVHRIRKSNALLVHAGLLPGRSIDSYEDYMPPWGPEIADIEIQVRRKNARERMKVTTMLRYIHQRDGRWSMRALDQVQPGDVWWANLWPALEPHIIYGHQPFREVRFSPNATGIDTGCAEGGMLTAVVIPHGERDRRNWPLISVPAARPYWTPPDGTSSFLDI